MHAITARSSSLRARPGRHPRSVAGSESHAATSRINCRNSTCIRAQPLVVYFKEEDIVVEAKSGEDVLDVASRAGVSIQTGCLHGSCGVCEVELTKIQDNGTPSPVVIRACIAKLPPGYDRVEIGQVPFDEIWGQDGFDT